ncbi:MAG: LysM peptidoglycan-binding domain-containing protein [Paludibacter sp.]
MKKQLFSLILTGFLLTSLSMLAQNKNYPTKNIKGTKCYIYTVGASEGLMAIGRKFDVSIIDITKVNQDLENELKVGQQIFIPINKNIFQKAEKEDVKSIEFIEHTVEKKQTLFAISKKYDISQDDIKKYNPQIDKGLHEGLVLKIPRLKKINKEKDKPAVAESKVPSKNSEITDKKKNIIHTVQPEETLYSISRLYKVEVVEIIQLNPGSANKLAIGTELKIPTNNGTSKTLIQKEDSNISKSSLQINHLFDKNDYSNLSSKKSIKIAFLLPFMLNQSKIDANNERFLDFYAGSLMAIEEAKQKGISFEIYTYDTEKSEEKVNEVLTNSELKTMDLIIGPAFSNQVSIVADFAKDNKINTLIPFTSKVPDIENNAYLFQFNPGADVELKFSKELFTGKFKNTNIVFAEIEGISSSDEGQIMSKSLQKTLNKEHKIFSELKLSNSENVDFNSVLKKEEKNIIIFNTDKYAYINPFIPNLKSSANDFDIVLFEQYSWRNQEKIIPQNIYISPFTTKLNPLQISDFNSKYKNYFCKNASKLSPSFDLLGYDLSNYFITLMKKYGNKFIDKVGSFNFSNGIQSQLQFERISNGSGFVNQKLYLGED